MTREEAIEYFKMKVSAREAIGNDIGTDYEAYKIALTALRPVSREQVEKVFSGCPACNDRRCTSCRCFGWYEEVCRKCENQIGYQPFKFCPYCGKPLRDEAVDMVMERMEGMKDD